MEIAEYKVFADKCFRDTPPPCAAVCPLACDVREFVKLMQRGSYRSAWRVYRNRVIFPSIVARLCPGRCASACVRGRLFDSAVDLKALEMACAEKMAGKKPDRFAILKKDRSVAVVGAGLSGLSAAYRLASFGYSVTVYEKTDRLGGAVGEALDPRWCHDELLREFTAVDCAFVFGREISSLDEISADAVYIATGAGGESFPDSRPGAFRGGALLGADLMESIAQGLRAADAVDVFMKIGRSDYDPSIPLRTPDERYYSLHYDPTVKTDPSGKGEAEAFRCMRCNCSECYDVCPLMEKDRFFPRKMCVETIATLKPNMSKRTAVYMIMGCTDCKRCRDVCPESIDMGRCLDNARIDFYESGAMSPAFHDYWLQDMAFSLSEEAYLVLRPDGEKDPGIVFFPGCQLGASLPDYVIRTYEAIRSAEEDAALYLGCCGVPARWAGIKAEADAVAGRIRTEWERLGRPKLLTACPTCARNLRESLPEAEIESVYVWLAGRPEALPAAKGGGTVYVSDPCASAEDPAAAEAVRNLLEKAGFTVYNEKTDPGCCGFGGHIYSSDRELHAAFARRRTEGVEGILAAYCANCRDVFAAAGSDARHVLGLLLGVDESRRRPPELDERRENRRRLKRFYTGAPEPEKKKEPPVVIPPELIDKMDRELILRSQVEENIRRAEAAGDSLYDEAADLRYAHARFGTVTLWTAYRPGDGELRVVNVYAHRVEIRED